MVLHTVSYLHVCMYSQEVRPGAIFRSVAENAEGFYFWEDEDCFLDLLKILGKPKIMVQNAGFSTMNRNCPKNASFRTQKKFFFSLYAKRSSILGPFSFL